MSGPYDDIIDLPHHVSGRRAKMSLHDRAAQFSPFAALAGYDAAVSETARLTDRRIELGIDARLELNRKLGWLQTLLPIQPTVSVTHFVVDQYKQGGAYVTAAGRVLKMNAVDKWLMLEDGTRICFGDILTLEGCPEPEESESEQGRG